LKIKYKGVLNKKVTEFGGRGLISRKHYQKDQRVLTVMKEFRSKDGVENRVCIIDFPICY